MKRKTITLKTLNKIRSIYETENKAMSPSHVSSKYGLHNHSVEIAVNELLNLKILEFIPSSSKGKLYQIKRSDNNAKVCDML